MKNILVVFAIGLVVIIATVGAFYNYVGLDRPISSNSSDWSNFGSYFGGVVGSIFSFLSIILLVYTIFQQSKNIKLANSEAIKLDMLRYLSRADEEIDQWLKTELASSKSDATVKFGAIVWGVVEPSYVNQTELEKSLERLLKLTCSYTSALALYEDNVDPYFIYKHHYTKAIDIIEFLEGQKNHLGNMAGASLSLCRHQLDA